MPLSFVPFRGIRPAVVVAPTPFQTFTLVTVTHLARFPTNAPRCSDPPIAKTKISTFCNFFAIGNSPPPWQRGNKPLHSHFRRVFGQQSAIGEIATIPNRKKVATKAEFLFLNSRGDFRMAL